MYQKKDLDFHSYSQIDISTGRIVDYDPFSHKIKSEAEEPIMGQQVLQESCHIKHEASNPVTTYRMAILNNITSC